MTPEFVRAVELVVRQYIADNGNETGLFGIPGEMAPVDTMSGATTQALKDAGFEFNSEINMWTTKLTDIVE